MQIPTLTPSPTKGHDLEQSCSLYLKVLKEAQLRAVYYPYSEKLKDYVHVF